MSSKNLFGTQRAFSCRVLLHGGGASPLRIQLLGERLLLSKRNGNWSREGCGRLAGLSDDGKIIVAAKTVFRLYAVIAAEKIQMNWKTPFARAKIGRPRDWVPMEANHLYATT